MNIKPDKLIGRMIKIDLYDQGPDLYGIILPNASSPRVLCNIYWINDGRLIKGYTISWAREHAI